MLNLYALTKTGSILSEMAWNMITIKSIATLALNSKFVYVDDGFGERIDSTIE